MLNITDQKGPLKLKLDDRYDIRIMVSEFHKDPTPSNCSYCLGPMRKMILMDPVVQKSNATRKASNKLTSFNVLYFKIALDEDSKTREIQL